MRHLDWDIPASGLADGDFDFGRLGGAVLGALIAGVGITALTMAMERKSGRPSELVELERRAAARLGDDKARARQTLHVMPDAAEQAIAQGGHLALSVVAGAAFAALIDEEAPTAASGVGFGLAFYALAHWITGPALDLKEPEWRAKPQEIGMHLANHTLFGLAIAWGARLMGRR